MIRPIGRATALAFASAIFVGTTAIAKTNIKNTAKNTIKHQEAEAVPGEYIVRLKENASFAIENKSDLSILSDELGSYIKTTIPDQKIVVIKRPVFENRDSVITTLSENALVEVVEPNYIYHMSRTPNDPMLSVLWGMKNIGQADSANQMGVADVDISAEKAWDIETGSKNVLVAVIDTGIDYNNADLKDNVWTNIAELNGKVGVDDDSNGFVDDIHGYNFVANTGDPLDDQGHGSHCSGTIGAKGNDGKGIVGVNWDVSIMAVKFLDKNGSGSLDNALKAIDYATKNGAKIMSNSWGGGGFSQTLKDAITRSNDAGALFLAAAGNDGSNNDTTASYPASYDIPNVLAVAAVGNRGEMASFSNYGKKSVHVGAPGVNITSTTVAGYQSWSGTSMATPHVTGIAALVAAHEPNLTNVELKNRIIATAKPLAGLNGKVSSGGMANAYNALTNTQAPPDPNDPTNWQSVAAAVSSAHPYLNKTNETYEVRVPGAKQIALYFDKFATEKDFDVVQIFDSKGNKVASMSGSFDESYSTVINDEYAKIIFTSDDSVTDNGFTITKAAFR